MHGLEAFVLLFGLFEVVFPMNRNGSPLWASDRVPSPGPVADFNVRFSSRDCRSHLWFNCHTFRLGDLCLTFRYKVTTMRGRSRGAPRGTLFLCRRMERREGVNEYSPKRG